MRRHGGRERVGGVDDGVDAFVAQPAPQAVHAAEAADAHGADGQRRVRHPARQGADDVDAGVQGFRQRARLAGAAEQQDAHQCLLPRARPVEYR